jgi:two-component sensor histidine kinase
MNQIRGSLDGDVNVDAIINDRHDEKKAAKTAVMTSSTDQPGKTPTPSRAGLVPLSAIVRTEELERRPYRAPDYEKENRALAKVVGALAEAPATILQTLVDTLLEVFKSGSAGMSLLCEEGDRFYWAAIAGAWSPHLGGGTPRDFGPCGDVLDCDGPILFTRWEQRYPYLSEATPLAEEGLLVPFHVNGKAVGTIWAIAHDDRRKFDGEDLRQFQSLGKFASAAYQAVQLQHAEQARRDLTGVNHSQQLLIDELNHRVKNTLATVQSIAAHTLTSSQVAVEKKTFEGRLIALSHTHDLLSLRRWESLSLQELLHQELDPFGCEDGGACTLDGSDLQISPKMGVALALALHELVTNAAKYGALSTLAGRVHVFWRIDRCLTSEVLRLDWTEAGGPLVVEPEREGFGLTTLKRGLAIELDGEVTIDFPSAGLVCTMRIPLLQ